MKPEEKWPFPQEQPREGFPDREGRKALPSVRQIEPAVWLISNCFSSEYFFLDILKLEKRIFSRLATRAAGSILTVRSKPPFFAPGS